VLKKDSPDHQPQRSHFAKLVVARLLAYDNTPSGDKQPLLEAHLDQSTLFLNQDAGQPGLTE